MKRLFVLLLVAFSVTVCHAQTNENDATPAQPSQKALDYYQTRRKITTPAYEYDKVKSIIDAIKPVSNDDSGGDDYVLSDDVYNKMSLREKFTYNMIHPENYTQNCDVPEIEEDADKKIYAYPPSAFDEYYWSKRQLDFFKDNRDSTIALMRQSIERSKKVGSNYKEIIVELKAIELIPILTAMEKWINPDNDILTVLNLLMKEGNYQPFMQSTSYKKLYSDEASSYKSYILFNQANKDLVVNRAMEFYNARHK